MRCHRVMDGAVAVSIGLFLEPPASWTKDKREAALKGDWYPTGFDLDNAAKALLDACNAIIWIDDRQVVELSIRKRYSTAARAMVEVTPL